MYVALLVVNRSINLIGKQDNHPASAADAHRVIAGLQRRQCSPRKTKPLTTNKVYKAVMKKEPEEPEFKCIKEVQ